MPRRRPPAPQPPPTHHHPACGLAVTAGASLACCDAYNGTVEAGPASTGVAALDSAVGGLYWGDNVVWEIRQAATSAPFYTALAHLPSQTDALCYVSLERDPQAIRSEYPGATILDGRVASDHERPGALLSAIRAFGARHARSVLLFDPLDCVIDRWGSEIARRFFARCCPMLLELGAIAYWSVGGSDQLAELRREVEMITQCVLVIDGDRLRVIKADGRGPGIEGSVHAYAIVDGAPQLRGAPAAARLASGLRAIRERRHLSQTELARIAGVSPSAISHAERGQSGLSLDTLVDLAGRLGASLDELLRGDEGPGYRLARRHDPRERAASATNLPLLDDPHVGLRVYLARLPARSATMPSIPHKGVEAVMVAHGLVQIELGERRAALRAGEALVAERRGITGWRNLGESEATLFVVLRDPLPEPTAG
jgi:transcriptional regulator with XRE-family HTH domain